MPNLTSAALLVFLSSTPWSPVTAALNREPRGGFVAAVHHPPKLARSPRIGQNAPAPRDSFKNGALIGAVIGGVTGALAGGTGCAAGSILSMSEESSSCTGPVLAGAVVGGLLGASIGVGVDALFDQAPSPPGVPAGRRRGVRLHFRF